MSLPSNVYNCFKYHTMYFFIVNDTCNLPLAIYDDTIAICQKCYVFVMSSLANGVVVLHNILRPLSLSELTLIIFNMELTNLGSESSIYSLKMLCLN